MSRKVNFDLGPAIDLASRSLIVTKMRLAGVDSAPAAEYSNTAIAGSATSQAVTLPNGVWQAVLIDTLNGGETSVPKTLNFQTGDLQFPGPYKDQFGIASMEDLSSSSSQSSSSSSSQSSSSSSSQSSSSSSSQSSSSS